jgi:heat shock protein HtpX
LQRGSGEDLPTQMAAFGISGKTKTGIAALFLSHPPLEQRIAALQAAKR